MLNSVLKENFLRKCITLPVKNELCVKIRWKGKADFLWNTRIYLRSPLFARYKLIQHSNRVQSNDTDLSAYQPCHSVHNKISQFVMSILKKILELHCEHLCQVLFYDSVLVIWLVDFCQVLAEVYLFHQKGFYFILHDF